MRQVLQSPINGDLHQFWVVFGTKILGMGCTLRRKILSLGSSLREKFLGILSFWIDNNFLSFVVQILIGYYIYTLEMTLKILPEFWNWGIQKFLQRTLSRHQKAKSPLQSFTKIARLNPLPLSQCWWFDYGVIGCQFSWETLPIITTLTEGGGDITLAAKAMIFLQQRHGSIKILGFYLLVSIYFVKDCLENFQTQAFCS